MDSPDYFLGHSEAETRRLILQGVILRPATERLLREAGLVQGMRVLDVGCGAGDVAMIASRIVGPTGAVVGLDQDETTIAGAADRATRAGLDIQFHAAAVQDRPELGRFDLAVGRLVLFHSVDPVAFVRDVASHVGPGGVVAFHEALPDPCLQHLSSSPLWNRVWAEGNRTVRASMPNHDVALRLVETFVEAGLERPHIFCDVAVDGGAQSPFYEWGALTAASVLPFLEKNGFASAAEWDVPTLEGRLREEAVTRNSQLMFMPSFCAHARKPTHALT